MPSALLRPPRSACGSLDLKLVVRLAEEVLPHLRKLKVLLCVWGEGGGLGHRVGAQGWGTGLGHRVEAQGWRVVAN